MTYYDDELCHFGIKGMKWGVRRYQNKDGSLTAAGRKRYWGVQNADGSMKIRKGDSRITRMVKRDYNRLSDKEFERKYAGSKKTYLKRVRKYGDPYMNSPLAKLGKALSAREQYKKTGKMPRTRKDFDRIARKELKEIKNSRQLKKWQKLGLIGAGALTAGLAAYGGYKMYRRHKLNNKMAKELADAIVKEATRRRDGLVGPFSVSNEQGVKANALFADMSRKAAAAKNYKNQFEDSIRTARAAGVPENKIIKSLDEGRLYFTSGDDLDNLTKNLLSKNAELLNRNKRKG